MKQKLKRCQLVSSTHTMMCEELISVPCFSRNDYAAILQKIPTEGIVNMTVKYSVFDKGDPPAGWKYTGIKKTELSYYGRRKTPAPPPISILDLPEIRPDCNNIQSIHIDTEKHRYEIGATQITIIGPDMPFTPADLKEAGVAIRHNGFIYKWGASPPKWGYD